MARKYKIRYTLSEKIVHGLATFLTLFWVFMLFFPIYWCVITSMKDPADALQEPPSFVPTTPYEYDVVLDYTADEWTGSRGHSQCRPPDCRDPQNWHRPAAGLKWEVSWEFLQKNRNATPA